MFFILSKILDFLLSPLVWIALIFIASLLVRNPTVKRRFIYSAIILLFLFSNSFLASEAFRKWEGEPMPLRSIGNYEMGVVLTGVAFDRSSAPDRVFFSKGADRVLHTVQLFKAGKIKKIIVTGGSGTLAGEKVSESSRIKEVLLYCGIPDSVLIIEEKSRNTRESAANTAKLIEKLNVESPILLITSAFHLPRASACFKKSGLSVDTYGVDYYTSDRNFTLKSIIPSGHAIDIWTVLIHEISGYWVYKWMGYF